MVWRLSLNTYKKIVSYYTNPSISALAPNTYKIRFYGAADDIQNCTQPRPIIHVRSHHTIYSNSGLLTVPRIKKKSAGCNHFRTNIPNISNWLNMCKVGVKGHCPGHSCDDRDHLWPETKLSISLHHLSSWPNSTLVQYNYTYAAISQWKLYTSSGPQLFWVVTILTWISDEFFFTENYLKKWGCLIIGV